MRATDLPTPLSGARGFGLPSWEQAAETARIGIRDVLSQHTPGARVALTLAVVVVVALVAAVASRLGTDPEAPFDLEARP